MADSRGFSVSSVNDASSGSSDDLNGLLKDFANDLNEGLSLPLKSIPSRWLYDAEGSRLFTKITELPEYDLTRNETEILQKNADAIANCLVGQKWRVVELGAGDGTKTEILLRAMLEAGIATEYWPIDISPAALDGLCARMSERLPALSCRAVVGDNLSGLNKIVSNRENERVLILDLGSSIGNRSREALQVSVAEVREFLREGDAALMGFDLVKDSKLMLAAYDDAAGVTRDFNLNLLTRMNRELVANFDLSKFRHEATWNPEIGGMESWLVSLEEQEVRISAIDRTFRFRKWEPIRTEISLKFNRDEIAQLAARNSYDVDSVYTDANENFVDVLWMAPGLSDGKKKERSTRPFHH